MNIDPKLLEQILALVHGTGNTLSMTTSPNMAGAVGAVASRFDPRLNDKSMGEVYDGITQAAKANDAYYMTNYMPSYAAGNVIGGLILEALMRGRGQQKEPEYKMPEVKDRGPGYEVSSVPYESLTPAEKEFFSRQQTYTNNSQYPSGRAALENSQDPNVQKLLKRTGWDKVTQVDNSPSYLDSLSKEELVKLLRSRYE